MRWIIHCLSDVHRLHSAWRKEKNVCCSQSNRQLWVLWTDVNEQMWTNGLPVMDCEIYNFWEWKGEKNGKKRAGKKKNPSVFRCLWWKATRGFDRALTSHGFPPASGLCDLDTCVWIHGELFYLNLAGNETLDYNTRKNKNSRARAKFARRCQRWQWFLSCKQSDELPKLLARLNCWRIHQV